MIRVIPFATLGRFQLDWLDSHFHFSFAGVPAPMGTRFGPLRVWNDDHIEARSGFDQHPHANMEIITYVRRGAISHRDSLGNEGRTPAGDVQVMTAGTGIHHAEWNREDEATLLYQIWIEPNRMGLEPGWRQAQFPRGDRAGKLIALASGQASVADALPIHQDATLYGALLPQGAALTHALAPGRRAYVVLADGKMTLNGSGLGPRDGAAVTESAEVELRAQTDSEVLVFDLP